MTDIRIVTSNGERLEVSNTFLTPAASDSLKEVLFSRSPAPSKKEVKVESHRSSRKAYNNTRILRRASNPPQPPPINQQRPTPAGGLIPSTHYPMDRLHDTSLSPFERAPEDQHKYDVQRRW